MKESRTLAHRIMPWVVSGASGLYIIRRARRLSLEAATDETLAQFLLHQGDLLVSIASSPTTWYIVHRAHQRQINGQSLAFPTAAELFHQLRRMLTLLVLGMELLRRKAIEGDITSMINTITILRKAVHEGQQALLELEQLYATEKTSTSMTAGGTHNGSTAGPLGGQSQD